ncbi:MAG: prepilin peptidase [Patescibacteria group bacterium]
MLVLESWLIYPIIFVLGLILGSYLNSWMWRVHEGRYVWLGRSMCVGCARSLAWYENIPLLSYLFLRGKCRTCKISIPSSYFFVELATGSLFLFLSIVDLNSGVSFARIFRDLFFGALFVVIFVYDAKYGEIILGSTWLGAIVAAFMNIKYFGFSFDSVLLGAAIGGGFFLFQYVVSKGKWIGGGDMHLGLLMGALLGWPNILVGLFVSYIVGAVISIGLILAGKKSMGSAIPFGTFLTVGTLVTMLWGDEIIKWYLGFLK